MTKQLIAEKLLEPLDWSKLKNVKKNVDPKFHNTPDDPKSTYSVVKDWGTTGFMYRTDKIKERPTTWREFVALTKKYGKTTMVDSSPEVVGSIATMLGYSYNTENKKELDAGQEGALRPQAVHRRAPLVQLRHAHREGQGVDGARLERRRPARSRGRFRRSTSSPRRAARSGSTTTTSRSGARIRTPRTRGSTSSTSRRSTASRRRTRTTARRSSGRC